MTTHLRASAIALAISVGWASPGLAQSADTAAIQKELAAMRAQMARMAERIDSLESQLSTARAEAQAASAQALEASGAANKAVAVASAKPDTTISWKGAPKIDGKGGWSFKPRGRLQIDAGGVDAPSGIAAGKELGFGTELRRAYLGVDGTMPGGFAYRVEADFANSEVDLTDLYLTYQAGPKVLLTVGQHKPFWSMEEMTSDLFTSFLERAAFNSGFGYERRVGASVQYAGKQLLVQAGAFTDNASDLSNGRNNSYSVDGRVVFMPKIGEGLLHIGGSVHFRDFNDASIAARYHARPFVHTTDLRLIDTGSFSATGERSVGGELAYIGGRFHATVESQWLKTRRPGLPDPTFNGGYAELGYMLTKDKSAYKNGAYDRIKPANPVTDGGMGALQVNARYDWLGLSDAGIVGGRQQVAGLSLLWLPTEYVRFLFDYGHLWLKDAAVTAGTKRDYSADSFGMRAQFDF